jgi:predicted HicB family RNase H-like nuclease
MEKKVDMSIKGLPLEVKRAIRVKAAEQDKSMNQLIIEILTEYAKKGGE